MSQKFESSFGGNPFQGFETRTRTPREGEVHIDKNPASRNTKGKVVGEYIEYEEIDS